MPFDQTPGLLGRIYEPEIDQQQVNHSYQMVSMLNLFTLRTVEEPLA